MSPDNVVRVSYPRDAPPPGETADKYLRAHETLDRWLAEGTWAREEWPAIYPYTQTYRAGGSEVTRSGFVALGEVTDYARGVVLPHERTHAGPKQDRMRHLETTGADVGLLFMLTADPQGVLREATAGEGAPIAEARDLRGELHRLWRLGDVEAIRRVAALMAPAQVIIADGHHRYETAVEYRRRHPAAEDKLMAFFALEAPGPLPGGLPHRADDAGGAAGRGARRRGAAAEVHALLSQAPRRSRVPPARGLTCARSASTSRGVGTGGRASARSRATACSARP